MLFSKTCKIALKAVSYLVTQSEEGILVSIKEISHKIEESEHTVGKTLQLLVKAKIIQSVKGPSGGFYIHGEQLTLSILHIIEAIEGKFIFNKCVLGYARCHSKNPCALHTEFKEARAGVEKVLHQTRIGDLELKKQLHPLI